VPDHLSLSTERCLPFAFLRRLLAGSPSPSLSISAPVTGSGCSDLDLATL